MWLINHLSLALSHERAITLSHHRLNDLKVRNRPKEVLARRHMSPPMTTRMRHASYVSRSMMVRQILMLRRYHSATRSGPTSTESLPTSAQRPK